MLLSDGDYLSLKKSVKGWTASKLRKYGIAWPPVKGWRKRLIRQYETIQGVESTENRIPRVDRAKRTRKQGFSLDREQLDRKGIAERERHATREWYRRMSGEVRWEDGERESFRVLFEGFSKEIERLNRRMSVEDPKICK